MLIGTVPSKKIDKTADAAQDPKGSKAAIAAKPSKKPVAKGAIDEAEVDVTPVDEDAVIVADDDEEDEDDDDEVVPAAVVARPVSRPQSNRPPSARDEPPPPFNIGERVIMTSNVRPRTGTPIADHPNGSAGSVETVLSQTAIIRFDRAPERKEVVAFTSLESTDLEAQARRKAEAKALAKAKKAAEAEAEAEAQA
jgi:hypothetical protein